MTCHRRVKATLLKAWLLAQAPKTKGGDDVELASSRSHAHVSRCMNGIKSFDASPIGLVAYHNYIYINVYSYHG